MDAEICTHGTTARTVPLLWQSRGHRMNDHGSIHQNASGVLRVGYSGTHWATRVRRFAPATPPPFPATSQEPRPSSTELQQTKRRSYTAGQSSCSLGPGCPVARRRTAPLLCAAMGAAAEAAGAQAAPRASQRGKRAMESATELTHLNHGCSGWRRCAASYPLRSAPRDAAAITTSVHQVSTRASEAGRGSG